MGFVASTCFQHNPATQPQAFTVLSCLATEEVDDDLIYQILVAMGSMLNQFSDRHLHLVVSMIRCLTKIVLNLLPDSRYTGCLFWLGIAILQIGHPPLFGPALDLTEASFMTLWKSGAFNNGMGHALMDGRDGAGEAALRLDQITGVSFETDLIFSLLAIIGKGLRQTSTKSQTIKLLMSFLRASKEQKKRMQNGNGSEADQTSNALVFALLPVLAGQKAELKELFAAAELQTTEGIIEDPASISAFDIISIQSVHQV